MSAITLDRLDHLVLTVADLDRTIAFYTDVLGMRATTFGNNRTALHFGPHKINLHQAGHEIDPKAAQPIPGSADLCLIATTPIPAVVEHLAAHNVEIEVGPVARTGAQGPMTSVYFRDPDGNLLELSNY